MAIFLVSFNLIHFIELNFKHNNIILPSGGNYARILPKDVNKRVSKGVLYPLGVLLSD
jgi:hypothetical protein